MNLLESENIPEFHLTDNEIKWLEELWSFTNKTGKIPEYASVRVKLLDQFIDDDFVPSKMDKLLVKDNATEITLLGVFHILKNHDEILTNLNNIIKYIKKKLIGDPHSREFSTRKIGEDLNLEEEYVRVILKLASQYGRFWDNARGLASSTLEKEFGWYEFKIEQSDSIDFYLNFKDFRLTLQEHFGKAEQTPSRFQPNISDAFVSTKNSDFVDSERVDQLKHLPKNNFDLSKLIKLCEELNSNYSQRNYYSIALLTRAIIDHVPPVLGYKTFREVANNYKCEGNERSFKDHMLRFENSLRKVGDASIHSQIRKSESLPTFVQVDFKSDLDVLLSEIVRVLKRH